MTAEKYSSGSSSFVAFAAFPFYFNIGKVNAKPEPKTDTPAIQEWVAN